jgi:hypothetical protein
MRTHQQLADTCVLKLYLIMVTLRPRLLSYILNIRFLGKEFKFVFLSVYCVVNIWPDLCTFFMPRNLIVCCLQNTTETMYYILKSTFLFKMLYHVIYLNFARGCTCARSIKAIEVLIVVQSVSVVGSIKFKSCSLFSYRVVLAVVLWIKLPSIATPALLRS